MANVLAELFQNVAIAIREKTGESGTMKPAEFPDKIRAIEAGSGGGTANLIPLTVTKNGKYYPSESFEFGKPFMFKTSYTQAELQMLAAMGTSSDGMSYLYEKGDTYLVVMFLGDIRVLVYTTSATEGCVYTEADISDVGLSAGWNTRSGNSYVAVTTPPSITFDASGTLHITDMSAIGLLFNVQNCDGFSEVTVNVASGGGGGSCTHVPLTVTKNGMYYPPTGNVEIGGTYTFKDSYTQEELKVFYDAYYSETEDAAVLYMNGESYGVAVTSVPLDDAVRYMLTVMNGEGNFIYVTEEIASALSFGAHGWLLSSDDSAPVSSDTPTLTFEESGTLYVPSLSDLKSLFTLSNADGFSSVEVKVDRENDDTYAIHEFKFTAESKEQFVTWDIGQIPDIMILTCNYSYTPGSIMMVVAYSRAMMNKFGNAIAGNFNATLIIGTIDGPVARVMNVPITHAIEEPLADSSYKVFGLPREATVDGFWIGYGEDSDPGDYGLTVGETYKVQVITGIT